MGFRPSECEKNKFFLKEKKLYIYIPGSIERPYPFANKSILFPTDETLEYKNPWISRKCH